MKHKILMLCPGRQTYLVALFEKYFNVFIGDNGQSTLDTYRHLPSLRLPKYDSEEYLKTLIDYIRENRLEYVLTLSDIEVVVLAKYEYLINKVNCKLIALPYSNAYACLDKYVFAKFLTDNGFCTPKTYIDPLLLQHDINRGRIQFPIIAKNRWGMGSKGLYIITKQIELDEYIKNQITITAPSFLGKIPESNLGIVFQEMINGQEYGIDIVNDTNRTYYTHLLKKKIEMRGGETDIAQITEMPEAHELAQMISMCFKHVGNLDCDFIFKDSHCYVIDINPRFGGGYIFSTMAGLDVPGLLYNWVNNLAVTPFVPNNLEKKYRKITNLIEI